MLRYRVGECSYLRALLTTMKWSPFFIIVNTTLSPILLFIDADEDRRV